MYIYYRCAVYELTKKKRQWTCGPVDQKKATDKNVLFPCQGTCLLLNIRLFEICFHFAGHRSSTQKFSAGPSEFLPNLHFLCKIVLFKAWQAMSYRYYYFSLAEHFLYLTLLVLVEA